MSTIFNTVRGFVKRHSMIDGAAGILVAVSGGADSVSLLDLLVRLTSGREGWGSGAGQNRDTKPANVPLTERYDARFPTPKPRIHIAHLDHKLRGLESDGDAEFVRGLASSLGLPLTINSVDVRAVAAACGRGFEEIAREVRYDFFLAAARDAGCDRVAVGHTMTDQAETFLMRLIRGAGLRGLASMRPVSEIPVFHRERAEGGMQKAGDQLLPSVLIIRPLLCITREEVAAYCNERGLEYRIDGSNEDLKYTRNRVRNEVLPTLKAINPRIVESIARASENIAGDEDLLDRVASVLLEETRLPQDVNGVRSAYSVTELLNHPPAIRQRMIIEAVRLTRAGAICERRGDLGEVTSAHFMAVAALLESGASGRHVMLPGTLEVWREFDALVFKRPASDGALYRSIIGSACSKVEAGGFVLTLSRGQSPDLLAATIEQTQQESKRNGRDWMMVALDDEALPDSLIVRPRRPGERAQVIGQRRTIKLKNLMIDHRIPSSRRAIWPLVTTPNGCYVWSPGLPPAVKYTAHDESHRLAIVRASVI